MAALGLCCCTRAFSGCSERGLLSSCGMGASHCGGISFCRAWALACRLRSGGTQACCPLACGILLTGVWTCVPCPGRWTVNHWTIREVLTKALTVSGTFGDDDDPNIRCSGPLHARLAEEQQGWQNKLKTHLDFKAVRAWAALTVSEKPF